MNSDKLKALAIIAAENKTMPEDIKQFVLTVLSKNDLKVFLRHFRNAISHKRIYVTSSDNLSKDEQANLKKLFTGKDMIYTINKDFGAGIKIQDNDTILDFTFKKYITDTIEKLKQDF